MNINKLSVIIGLALGGIVACSNMALAQDQKPGGGRGRGPSVEQRMERMTEELKLTDEQKPKVKTVLEASQKKRQELFTDSSVPREERREKMQGIMEEENKKLKEILTADQYSKHEKMREQMRPGGPRGERKREDKKEGDTKKD